MNVAVTAIIAGACSILSVLLTLYSEGRSKAKDLVEEGRKQGTIDTKLGYIQQGVDEIRINNATHAKHLGEIDVRLTSVEDRAKSNTHRLDDIDGKSYKEKEGEDKHV